MVATLVHKDGNFGFFRVVKRRKRREEREKEKGKKRKKEKGKRPSYSPRRCAILGGASGRFWLGQAHSVSE